MTETRYMIYDSRYHTGPHRAHIFSVCDTLAEANEEKDEYGTDCVIVKAEVVDGVIKSEEIVA